MATFPVKDWIDYPSTATQITAVALEDLEQRLADWAGRISEVALRSSDVGTFDRRFAQNSFVPSTGFVYAAAAVALSTTAQTKIRFNVQNTPSGVTALRYGIWDSGGTKITETADVTATVTASGIYEIALSATFNPTLGTIYFLGQGAAGTTPPSLRSVSMDSSMAAKATVLSRGASYVSGALPALTTSGFSGSLPWMELIP